MKQRIRALEREDIPQVASLYELVMRSGTRTAPAGLETYFERTVLDYPWADPEIPSLVYEEDDGEITGFIASHVRRIKAGEEPLRIAYGGQLVVDPRVRHKAVGALLMRRHFAGAQDVTLTDTAGVATHAMWGKLRGEEVSLGCVFWTHLFRPWRFTGDYLLPQRPARLAHPVWSVLDAVTTRVPGFRFRTPGPKLYAEELTPRALIDAVDLFAPSLTVRPDYDEPFLDWLFAEMSEVTTYGTLVRTLLRDDDGRVRGWYVYYLLPGGTSYVLQLMADEGSVGDTIDHLLHDARSGGSAALRGRLEPRLLEPLARRRCLFRYEGGALIHTENIGVLNAIAYGHSLLTRMDGEWWMGHHVEPFEPVQSSTDRTAMPTVR